LGNDLITSAGLAGSQVSGSITAAGDAASITARTALASKASALDASAPNSRRRSTPGPVRFIPVTR
jgi:hypothetical protein